MYESMSAFDRIRERGSRLLTELGMNALADKLRPDLNTAFVSGPEMEQQ